MDLTATVAAAGSAKPRSDTPFDGVDLLGPLTGQVKLDADRPLFFRRRTVVAWKGENAIRQSAVRQGVWKYLRTYNKRDSSKFTAALYNLNEDIAEARDLAASHGEKLQALSDLLDGWESEMSKTAIPFDVGPRKKR